MMNLASDKQVKFLQVLLKTKDLSTCLPALKNLSADEAACLSKAEAFRIIDLLVKLPAPSAPTQQAQTATQGGTMKPYAAQHQHRFVSRGRQNGFKGATYEYFECAVPGCDAVQDLAHYPNYFGKGPKTVKHAYARGWVTR